MFVNEENNFFYLNKSFLIMKRNCIILNKLTFVVLMAANNNIINVKYM